MAFKLLLDEMTEAGLAEYLAKMDHDVERVVDCPELGPGTDDSEIVNYAEDENRLLVTYDDDFLADHEARRRIGILFQPNGRMPAFDTANVINEIAKHVDQDAVTGYEEAYHLTDSWL